MSQNFSREFHADVAKVYDFLILTTFYSFLERDGDRVHVRASARKQGTGRGRGRERIPSRVHAVSAEPDMGFDLTTVKS